MTTENSIMPAAASEAVGWRDPEWCPPPRGRKLLILTAGGVAILGPWADDVGHHAWSYLPSKTTRIGAPT